MKLTFALCGIVAFSVCAACASPKPDADSTASLPAPDTMKPGPGSAKESDSVAGVDSTPARGAAVTPATRTVTKSPAPVTKSPARIKPTPRDSTIMGRDSVIMRRPRRLPPDTPRSP